VIDLTKARRELRRVSAVAGVGSLAIHSHAVTNPIDGDRVYQRAKAAALTSFGGSVAPEATQTGTGTSMTAELRDALAAQSTIFDERLAKAMAGQRSHFNEQAAAQQSHFDEQAAAQRSHFDEQIQQVLNAVSGTRGGGTA
jgi:hypothetical protein